MRAVKAQALQLENDQLRKIIGLGSRLEWGFVPAEALHSTVPSEDVVHDDDADGGEHRRHASGTARSSRRRGWSARFRAPIRR